MGNVQNTVFCPGRWKIAAKTVWVAAYRRNQAHTFNHMIQLSEFWEPGRWFMTYDCDQFYNDETISKFSITNEDTDFGLLTADEYTFVDSFWKYTEEYEERNFNNLPHKIYPDNTIKPTRVLYRACKPHQKNGIFASHLYRDNVKTHDIGWYHHYKMKEEARTRKAYELGDRKEPRWKKYNMKNFQGEHPEIIQDEFL